MSKDDYMKPTIGHYQQSASIGYVMELRGTIADTHRMIAGLVEQNSELINLVLTMRDELAIMRADNANIKTDVQTISNVFITALGEGK